MLNRAPLMIFAFGLNVTLMRKLRSLETPDARNLPIYGDVRDPDAILFTPRRAKKPAAFISYGSLPKILHIFPRRCLAKINKAVISTNAVNVIDVMRREMPMHKNPYEAVCEKVLTVYVNLDITGVVPRPGDVAKVDAPRCDFDPCKVPGARVVTQKLAQAKHANILGTHSSSSKAVVVRSRSCVDAQPDSAHYTAVA